MSRRCIFHRLRRVVHTPRQVSTGQWAVCEHRMQQQKIGRRKIIPGLEMLKSLSNINDVPCNLSFIVSDFTIFPESFGVFHILTWTLPFGSPITLCPCIYLPHFAWQTFWLLHCAKHLPSVHKAHVAGVWQKWTEVRRLVNGCLRKPKGPQSQVALSLAVHHVLHWPSGRWNLLFAW